MCNKRLKCVFCVCIYGIIVGRFVFIFLNVVPLCLRVRVHKLLYINANMVITSLCMNCVKVNDLNIIWCISASFMHIFCMQMSPYVQSILTKLSSKLLFLTTCSLPAFRPTLTHTHTHTVSGKLCN